jgi:hypothetical protein
MILQAHSYLIMERIEPTDEEEERPSLVMHKIEPMDDEPRQRIEDVIRDVEGVTTDLDESTSSSIKELIGERRQLVKNLSYVGPGLWLFEETFYPKMMRTEKQEALEILEVEHRKDYIALVKEYNKDEEDNRRMYGIAERRGRLGAFCLGQQKRELMDILDKNHIEYDSPPMPDFEAMSV